MKFFLATLAVLTLAAHFCFHCYRKVDDLETQLKIASQKEKIDQDQIRELIYLNDDLSRNKEVVKSQGYIAGILDGIKREDHWNSVWHDGYNRGSEVREFVAESFIKGKSETVIEASGKK